MDKIYSRPRIKLPNFSKIRLKNNPNSKNVKKSLKLIIILLIAIATAKYIIDTATPIFETLCINKSKSMATIISNTETINVMKSHSYDELFTIEKDADGNVTMIKSNMVSINEITSEIATNIQKELDNKGRENIQIALGSFTGIKILSGRGPGVPIRISSVGNIDTELKSEFEAQGINQTLHRVYLQLTCRVNILTPFEDIENEITNQVLLAENIIVGKIPETYYNLEGLTPENDAMEVIN